MYKEFDITYRLEEKQSIENCWLQKLSDALGYTLEDKRNHVLIHNNIPFIFDA